jgi:hypothetical protein
MRKTIIMFLFVVLLFKMSVLLCGVIPAKERSALIALYNSTNGDNWVNNEGWKMSPLHTDGFSLPGTEGNWKGITVTNDQVEKIYLVSNNLSGTIPAQLGNLSSLKELRLNGNQLEGNIPAVLSNLSYLTSLALHSNKLSGSIPFSLIYLSLLSDLNVGYNALYTDDDILRGFLNSKDPNWETTQTTAPSDLSAVALSGSSVEVSWTPISYTADPGGYRVYYSTESGKNYTLFTGITTDKSISKMEVTGLNPGTTYYFVVQTRTDPHTNNQNTVVSSYSREVTTAGPTTPPEIFLNRSQLNFGYVIGGATPSAQTFRISNSGGGILNWAVVNWFNRISVSPVSGSGSGVVEVLMDPAGLNAGNFTAEVQVIADYASNSPQVVNINLTVKKSPGNQPPFGTLSTPENNSPASGSIPVTGWALDDIGVESVKIYRSPVSGEGNELKYLGDAIFVEGARPDIEGAYPDYPNNYKAGWGYMLLTNLLPGPPDGVRGNGTFTLYAKARDLGGEETTLGTATIICDNANAKKPFGAIDYPAQGGTASGSSYRNRGWVLTPQPNKIPEDGSTIDVYVDSVKLGNPQYNIPRPGIAEYFPGYANSDGPAAEYTFDTTAYSNGVHTIHWIAADDAGNTEGIGSRYFTIQNSGVSGQVSVVKGESFEYSHEILSKIPIDYFGSIGIRKGYRKDVEPQQIYPDDNGIINIEIKELERLEIRFNNDCITDESITGRSTLNIEPRTLNSSPLPIGSTLDQKRGVFYWQPGPGFYGDYDFIFIKAGGNDKEQVRIRIKILPRFDSR